jgi:hypothetical protein
MVARGVLGNTPIRVSGFRWGRFAWRYFAQLMVSLLRARAREISWKARGRRPQEVGRPKWQVVSVQACDRIMNHVGGFAMASWNFYKHSGPMQGWRAR